MRHAPARRNSGASMRAPYPIATNQPALTAIAPSANAVRAPSGSRAPAVPISRNVSRYTCGLSHVNASVIKMIGTARCTSLADAEDGVDDEDEEDAESGEPASSTAPLGRNARRNALMPNHAR